MVCAPAAVCFAQFVYVVPLVSDGRCKAGLMKSVSDNGRAKPDAASGLLLSVSCRAHVPRNILISICRMRLAQLPNHYGVVGLLALCIKR